ncbi:DNA mismatch repair protein MutL [Xylariaceae sp. FL1651]|nr:DNA mismatch repair protein MutL [Xylariaceae sp. FL1651]
MATIKAIEARTIHQIQSGQVIVDLCSVVKELVENSIDAGATNIEVRFKNQGLDAIEVQDNGSGISKENYETLALKHYTSKLSTYSDLESLETFGFRGEALSSLCALSKFTVITCLASDAPKGSKLEFETSGKLCNTGVVAAQKGTTVSVENLFHNLPVRRRELERNIKREWNKVLGVLNQYACIQTGLKFSVSQQPNKGKRMVLFSTKGNQTTRENIVNVFGAKTLAVLIPLDLELELEPTGTSVLRPKAQEDSQAKVIRIRGHVSRPAYGEGRQTPDRQMFFVNGRPCGLPQFAKVFNEVYKSYNASQSPFIFADIQLDTHLYDVNVSPDKRTILLHDQTRMLDNLRESLSTLFESQDYALPISQLLAQKQAPFKKLSLNRQDTVSSEAGSKRSVSVDVGVPRIPASADSQREIDDKNADSVNNDEAQSDTISKISLSVKAPAQAVHNSSLISRWVERKCDLRVDAEAKNSRAAEVLGEEDRAQAEDPQPSLSPGIEEQPPTNAVLDEVPKSAAHFHAHLEELKDMKGAEITGDSTPCERESPEPSIPALAAPARITDIKSSIAYPSSSVKRSAPEVATITIGGHTVTSIIGSPSKRQRLDSQPSRRLSARQAAKEAAPVPSFNGRLTQMFAAHAEQSQSNTTQIEIATGVRDISEQSDSSSERLFVDDDARESDCESEASLQSTAVDLKHASPKDSPKFEPNAAHDPEAEPTSLTHPSDDEYSDDDSQVAKEGSNAHGSAESPEVSAGNVSEETQKRTQSFIKGGTKKKDATCNIQQILRTDETLIRGALAMQQEYIDGISSSSKAVLEADQLDAEDAEEKLSLTISKSDFGKMKIIGQFNLGFILACRAAKGGTNDTMEKGDRDDELFIIDQHATDEKYNFERLQATTVVQSQRLVRPKVLELTAVEEDIVQENLDALEANGFIVNVDNSGDEPVGTRCQLLSLPLSRETTFSLTDLEELISLLRDHQSTSANTVPRPSKVRKMFAMRACRSSVMIGKALSTKQMEKLVRHMGELDKPWNCPHGRPTMRHLCGLSAWDDLGWKEGDGFNSGKASSTDWAAYARRERDM